MDGQQTGAGMRAVRASRRTACGAIQRKAGLVLPRTVPRHVAKSAPPQWHQPRAARAVRSEKGLPATGVRAQARSADAGLTTVNPLGRAGSIRLRLRFCAR